MGRWYRHFAGSLGLVTACVGALLGIGQSVTATPAFAQNLGYRPPSTVPPSWTRFAELVQSRFREWLAADDDVAYRFHLFLENRLVKDDVPPDSLVVKVWIKPDGAIDRVDFPALADKQADEDLHAILAGGDVGEPPPPDMLQPLHLRLSLHFKG